jgi:hypothetical protein
MVNRELAQGIIGSLQLSGIPYDFSQLIGFSSRDWDQTLGWLDHSGLALYLLKRLKDVGAPHVLPSQVLARFEENLADNKCRVQQLLSETGCINEKFNQAGVHYVVVKGLSLWPEFCSDPYLRTQCDVDYLVSRRSLSAAKNVLAESGYEAKRRSPVQFEYERPLQRVPSQYDSPYKVQTTPTIELHVGIWEDVRHQVPLEEPAFVLDDPKLQEWGGLQFPVLSDEDAFLLQVLHAFQHLLSYWVKPSWLFEIGTFMEKRSQDSVFWNQFARRLEDQPLYAEFATITLELTAKMFSAPMPDVVQRWRGRLRRSTRLWLDNYGRSWALSERPPHRSRVFPSSKLSLFFQTEYIPDERARRDFLRRELIPWKVPGKQPSVAFEQVKSKPWTRVQARWLDSAFTVQRLSYHASAGLRYLWELPRWRSLSRSRQVF